VDQFYCTVHTHISCIIPVFIQSNLASKYHQGQTNKLLTIERIQYLLSIRSIYIFTISVVFSTVHEVGREQGVLGAVFSIVHEVGIELGVLGVVFSTVHEVGIEQGVLTIQ
jgi:hypothetical protein